MQSITRHGVDIQITQGDITDQPDIEVVVNAANAELRTGGGVAGAIHQSAGPELREETRPLAPIEPGEAVLTEGYDLPNESIIHCLGPRYGRDQPSERLLASCYRRALEIAEREGLRSIACPALSTGAFGYPTEEATEVAFRAVLDQTPELESLEVIRFVLFSEDDYEIYARHLDSHDIDTPSLS